MRIRITVRGDAPRIELRGYLDLVDDDATRLHAFADAMLPFGIVVASHEADDYDPFTEWTA